jgi:hypothetical protein
MYRWHYDKTNGWGHIEAESPAALADALEALAAEAITAANALRGAA